MKVGLRKSPWKSKRVAGYDKERLKARG